MGVETIPFTPITLIDTRDAVLTGLFQVRLRIDECVTRVRAREIARPKRPNRNGR
jgi:hypothetical protein